MFAHLEHRHNARLVFDPSYPVIDMSVFKDCDWKHFYGDVKEALPPNAPTPRGKEVDLRLFCDSDHAGDKLRRRSRSGCLIYVNSALVVWYSKRQPTIETSVFGAEFVAMKQGMETLRGLRYKLRMMGVPITFLDKYNPEQFEIVKFRKGDDDRDLVINGKSPYFRIIIKNKKL